MSVPAFDAIAPDPALAPHRRSRSDLSRGFRRFNSAKDRFGALPVLCRLPWLIRMAELRTGPHPGMSNQIDAPCPAPWAHDLDRAAGGRNHRAGLISPQARGLLLAAACAPK
jgi:hypothetical protein